MPLIAPALIEATRVVIRHVADVDLAALLEVNADEEVTALLPYATWRSMTDAEAWLERMHRIEATGLAVQFVIVSKSTDTPIGTCLLFRFEEESARAELGYVLGRAHWGQGLMHEALVALVDCAFTDMRLRRLEAEIDPRNARSIRIIERLGFTREGVLRQRWMTKGRPRDVAMYGLLDDEWRDARASPGRPQAR